MKKEYDVEVEWKAFELHPEYPPEGMVREISNDPNRQAMREHLRSMAAEANRLIVDRNHVSSSRLSLEAAEYAREKGKFDAFHDALFQAYFSEGKDIGDKAVLSELARQAGLDADDLLASLAKRTYRDAVEAQLEEARELGVTAVPTFVIDNRAIVGAQPYKIFEIVMSSLNEDDDDDW